MKNHILKLFMTCCLAMGVGLLSAQTFCNPAVFEGNLNPSVGVQTATPTGTGTLRYWAFSGLASNSYTFSTCGSYTSDTYLRIYDSADNQVATSDDACSLQSEIGSWSPASDGTYYIVLANFFCNGITQANPMSYSIAAPPTGNDACSGAEPISCGGSVNGTTAGATPDGAATCGTTNTAPGVWYRFDSGADQITTFSLCTGTSYDSKLSVYDATGVGCSGLTCLGGNDDSCGLQSEVTVNVNAGGSYYVLVHGFGSSTGSFTLTATCFAPPANDSPCGAEALTLGVDGIYDNSGAGADAGEVSPGAGTGTSSCDSQDGWCSFETDVDNSLWFTFVAPASGAVSVDAPGYDSQLAIWSVGDCADYGTYTEIGANDDGGNGFFAAYIELACLTEGATYYVQVDGFGGASSGAFAKITVEDLGGAPLSVDAGDCQTHFTGYEPAAILNHLLGTASGGEAPYAYSWSGDGIVTNAGKQTVSVDPSVSTMYTVTVTDARGCTASASVDVFVENLICNSNNGKITICHYPSDNDGVDGNTLCLPPSALDAHLGEENHGDVYGNCDNLCRATNPPPPVCVDLTVDLITDDFGGETSWTLTSNETGATIAEAAVGTLTSGTAYQVTECVDPGCYTFTINDSFGDGICCSFGNGSVLVTYDGVVTDMNPFTEGIQTYEVGDCGLSYSGSEAIVDNDQKGSSSISNLVDIQVTPNPFNSTALISFVPSTDGNAVINIYDLNGSLVAKVFDADVKQGQAISTEINGEQLKSNGMYFYHVIIGDQLHTGKLVYTD